MAFDSDNLNREFTLLFFDELVKSTGGSILFNFSPVNGFTSVVIDSRGVRPNSLFVPLRGEKQDGHIYIEDALKNGAVCFFADTEYVRLEENKITLEKLCKKYYACCITVKNNLYALQAASKFYLTKFPGLYKIGVTGSSGKTTTKEILASIYSLKYNTAVNKGNLNSETGLPLSIFTVRPEHEVGIFELGMNRKGEIAELANILLPNAAIITNIGSAHIGILGTKKAIAEEKKEIFSNFTDNCTGFVPDCKFTEFLKSVPAGKIYVYSADKNSNIKKIEENGTEGSVIFYKDEKILFPLAGKYNIDNAAACIALAEKDNFSASEIKKGLEAVRPLFGRSQIIRGLATCFFDCYNANPDSMSEAIDFCNSVKSEGIKHYVLASMRELGKESEASHKLIAEKVLSSEADIIYFFGDEFAFVLKNCDKKNKRVFIFKTDEFENLKNALKENLNKGDFVLLKGSRGLELERLEEVLKPEAGNE
ncbi:UDP-N-acetylmuramoyl-tripeptide--D-alanyl-D-alanine ligase [Treponema pedis]|uniref:UDP-N-acetylmuramoyl-tripeptide--D-alanyl-D-alanine ligase n=1 Tax=Treponema pedis str. T A4 TaxID=1291379 RepID=S6A4N8_9SPIR|nr:UDP-N-acetylmuramoyl-tripeptide--D-alanyl-D-alanine ligase [Treponema pedis]AGT44596.1 UDP-N-acetylmuramoylalanyl-D-glutamyl-2, 6-diaminopimelate--D-alanyl-D-alanyl ligase [Treponema pedis str. T A4]